MDNLEDVKFCQACKCSKLVKFFRIKKNGEYNKTCVVCNNRYSKNKIIIHSTYKPVEGTTQKCVKCKKSLDIVNFRVKKYVNDVNKTCNKCILAIIT
jgi:hypothetical protein